jgi:DNA-directed RNA polymerase specialized sigma24 family protein
LARFEHPDQLIAFLWERKASPVDKDRMLAALLRLSRSEPLAGRVVLQAMLPGLKALAAVFLKRDPAGESEPALEREELWQVLFVSMLERIKTYPLARRPERIAANLVLDTKHATLAEMQRARSGYRELPRDEPLEPIAESAPYTAEDVEAPLRRAVAARAISEADADLLLWVDVDGMPLREAAARLGISYNAAKIRRQRARRVLLMFLRPWTRNLYVRDDPKGASDRPSSGAYAPEALEETAEQAG